MQAKQASEQKPSNRPFPLMGIQCRVGSCLLCVYSNNRRRCQTFDALTIASFERLDSEGKLLMEHHLSTSCSRILYFYLRTYAVPAEHRYIGIADIVAQQEEEEVVGGRDGKKKVG